MFHLCSRRCFAHRFHLVIRFGLGDSNVSRIVVEDGEEVVLEEEVVGPEGYAIPTGLVDLLKKIRGVVRIIKSRSPMVEFIKRQDLAQQAAGINVHHLRLPRSVKADMAVRWSSTEAMLERFLLLRQPIQVLQVAAEHRAAFADDQILNEGDFALARALLDILEPFSSATKLLSYQDRPTFGIGIYLEFLLTYKINRLRHPTPPAPAPTGVIDTVRLLVSHSEKRLSQVLRRLEGGMAYYFPPRPSLGPGLPVGRLADDEVLAIVFDLRCRDANGSFPAFFQIHEFNLFSKTGRARRLVREAKARFPLPPPPPPPAQPAGADAPPAPGPAATQPPKKMFKSLALDTAVEMDDGAFILLSVSVSSRLIPPVDRFFKEGGIALDENPLDWWREHGDKYGAICPAARYVLAIPGTSVVSESTNSEAGWILDKRRGGIGAHKAAKLVYLKRNLRNHAENFTF